MVGSMMIGNYCCHAKILPAQHFHWACSQPLGSKPPTPWESAHNPSGASSLGVLGLLDIEGRSAAVVESAFGGEKGSSLRVDMA